ncbi:MAG TPA: NAD(P)/FAD-dependent oxidoreductase [bacterium]|jgi:protoporphyrinogen oxidase|nr:NAD(P)/FAD-dependent oxidoreductase [bacterium]
MKIAVIGGGVAGLTAAYRLAQKNHEVDVFEASDHVGGLASGFSVAGTSLEKYYHHLFTSDHSIRGLVQELGLSDKLQWFTSQMGFYNGGRIYPFGTPQQLLTFKPLPLWERIWFGIVSLYLGKKNDWKEFEEVTAAEWIKKHSGPHTWNVIWQPLLKGKFGRYYDQVAMAWLWARIHTRFSSRKGSEEKLGYFEGGFEVFHKALAKAVEAKGAKIHLKTPVEKITVSNNKLTGLVVQGEEKKYDRLVFSAATPIFLKCCGTLPEDYVKRLTHLEYLGAQCLILVMKRPFSGIYWMNIGESSIPILALIEHTNFAPRSWYQGKHLMYIANYLPRDHQYFQMTKEQLFAEHLPHLKKINPDFDPSWVEESFVFQDFYAQPVVPLHYSQVKPTYETPIENLYLANMALVYPEDRGTNFAVQVGDKVSQLVDPSISIPAFKEPS